MCNLGREDLQYLMFANVDPNYHSRYSVLMKSSGGPGPGGLN